MFQYMFMGATAFNQPIDNWDVENRLFAEAINTGNS